MGLFGSNTMSFLGGVAEGASKEIARQQSSIDALIKDASQVIMADRLATRKRRQTRMSDLGDKYNVLRNKGLNDSSIKVVLEQDLYDDIIKISKKPGVTKAKLNSFVGVTGDTDVNVDKSSLLNYLTRDIVDTDLSGMKFTGGGVDTLAALGLRRPVGETIKAKTDLVTPKRTIEVDDNISKIGGSLSQAGQRALDTRSKTSPAAFQRLAQKVLAKQMGVKLDFISDITSPTGYRLQTEEGKEDTYNKVFEAASKLTVEYDQIVFKDFSMDDSAASNYLLYPEGKPITIAEINVNNPKNTKDKTSESNVVPEKSVIPSFSTILGNNNKTDKSLFDLKNKKSTSNALDFSLLNNSIKVSTANGLTKISPGEKGDIIQDLVIQLTTNNTSLDQSVAYNMAKKIVSDRLKEEGL